MERNFGVRSKGMQVAAVTRLSNAERFGLLAGDLVLAINDRSIPPGVDLVEILSVNDFGAELTLAVARAGETLELTEVFQPAIVSVLRKVFSSERPAGLDNDRTMLFPADLRIEVP